MDSNTEKAFARGAATVAPAGEGATREELRQRLYEIWSRTPAREPLPAVGAQIAGALVFLRRNAVPTYRTHQHAAYRALEEQRLSPGRTRIAMAYALPVKATVAIVGSSQRGVIIHAEVGQDENDPSPTPWYVAAIPGQRTCEAFGADELEILEPHGMWNTTSASAPASA